MLKRYLCFSLIILVLISTIFFLKQFTSESYTENRTKPNSQVTSWGYDLLKSDIYLNDSDKIKVAIIDSGINKNHEDLKYLRFKEYNVLEKNIPITDEFGHGTSIAGIIAANDNNFGVRGLTNNIEIFDVKILNEEGKGEIENLIEGIEWCIDQNVEIINLSFGFQTENEQLKEVINKAVEEDIIIVASIGNTFGMQGNYPAKYDEVISITSISESLKRSNFASRNNIDFAMPGEDIYTTNNEGGYSMVDGTSFATAHATGVISNLLLLYRQEEQTISFKEYLELFSYKEQGWNYIDYGNGILKQEKRIDNEKIK